ncbi:hypothetical protein Syun_017319 [Stephania yunnanensis]|uniref:Uncharacterized protein n=1 Tax=Stephania yunnanensis TaxID=152371 RepID=A0AAP0J918_9MAGN
MVSIKDDITKNEKLREDVYALGGKGNKSDGTGRNDISSKVTSMGWDTKMDLVISEEGDLTASEDELDTKVYSSKNLCTIMEKPWQYSVIAKLIGRTIGVSRFMALSYENLDSEGPQTTQQRAISCETTFTSQRKGGSKGGPKHSKSNVNGKKENLKAINETQAK